MPYASVKSGALTLNQLILIAMAPTSQNAGLDKKSAQWTVNELNYEINSKNIGDFTVVVCPAHMFLEFSFAFIR
jgi:hypothetical protein